LEWAGKTLSNKQTLCKITFEITKMKDENMLRYYLCFVIFVLLFSGYIDKTASPDNSNSRKLLAPPEGIYHCAFPDFGAAEDNVTTERIVEFENLVGKPIVWAYFSNNWIEGINFPEASVRIIHEQGVIPFIRMMPRSIYEYEGGPDPVYTMQRIIEGSFDAELARWAEAAKRTNIPLMVEFGTEVNGDSSPWSGRWNGGGDMNQYGDSNLPDGPERFRDAYRHIIDLFRAQGVKNISWVFHVYAQGWPEESWNNMAAYYPGDDYIDWIGVSIFGPGKPGKAWQTFTEILDGCYLEFSAISTEKPLVILEFGVVDDSATGDKVAWIREALESIKSGRYPRIKAISYWHETWENNDGTLSNLRVDSSLESLEVYREEIADPFFVTNAYFSDGDN